MASGRAPSGIGHSAEKPRESVPGPRISTRAWTAGVSVHSPVLRPLEGVDVPASLPWIPPGESSFPALPRHGAAAKAAASRDDILPASQGPRPRKMRAWPR